MAIQKINLLNALPERRALYFLFYVFRVVVLGWTGFLIALFIILALLPIVKSTQIDNLKRQKLQIMHTLNDLSKNEASKNNMEVKTRIEQLTSEIASKKKLLLLLQTQNKIKFSDFMDELSKRTPDNLWIERVEIIPQSNSVKIQGGTLNADLIPLFAHQLMGMPIVESQKFSVLSIINKKNHFDFTLQTNTNENEKNAKPII